MEQRLLENSRYHSLLRVAALTSALTLVFVSGLLHPVTATLTLDAEQYVATSINATAGVAPTELNQITAALTEQQSSLDEREAGLRERELALGLRQYESGSQWSSETVTYVNSVILFVILLLMVINYALDFRARTRLSV